jgi:hypothetical protein
MASVRMFEEGYRIWVLRIRFRYVRRVMRLWVMLDGHLHMRCYREPRKPSHWVTPISARQDRVPRMIFGLPVLQVVLRVL